MTTLPKLDDKNTDYAIETIKYIDANTGNRRAGSEGEKRAQQFFYEELKKYCDEAKEQSFITHPGAGTTIEKLLCALLIIFTILFFVSILKGMIFPVAITLFLSVFVFCVFIYKFVFDGTKLDKIREKKKSANLLGTRYSRGETGMRVVFTARTDSPLSMRGPITDSRLPVLLSVCTILGNTILFCSQLLFLFLGAPKSSPFFIALGVICLIFIPVYIISMLIIRQSKCASGVSAGLVPVSVLLSIAKQFSENGTRYEKTEVALLLTGSEYSARAGAYAFAKKHKRLFTDVRTVFIPIEEITSSDNFSVFFNDAGNTRGSAEAASVIAQAADNLNLNLSKEFPKTGSAAYTPFSKNYFQACSVGTSKKYISKCFSLYGDKAEDVNKKTIEDLAALLIETLNYYDS